MLLVSALPISLASAARDAAIADGLSGFKVFSSPKMTPEWGRSSVFKAAGEERSPGARRLRRFTVRHSRRPSKNPAPIICTVKRRKRRAPRASLPAHYTALSTYDPCGFSNHALNKALCPLLRLLTSAATRRGWRARAIPSRRLETGNWAPKG